MNKKEIIEQMKVVSKIDLDHEVKRRIEFIQAQLIASKMSALVLGISGGIDSTTCGRLAQLDIEQLNENNDKTPFQFITVRLPFSVQADEEDAQLSLKFIQSDSNITVNISNATNAIHDEVADALKDLNSKVKGASQIDFVKGNVKARMRMIAQYEVAGLVNGLVIGTDHSAENITGFYTKFGDGACDLAPLFGLNKRQIRQIAKYLGAPQKLVDKTPTADLETLKPSLSDEQALGLSYEQIDDFLEGKELDKEIEEKIINIFNRTEHKRQPIPTLYD